MASTTTPPPASASPPEDGYKWVALANTTAAVFMSQLDGSIVLIALPAIFKGIDLDPLLPGNIVFLLWMILGYRLVQAVFVVTVGRLGDMFGRVRIYNGGFLVFTLASVALSFDPAHGAHGALWLILWRFPQALGGSMLQANSAAILVDAFPDEQRGFALGTNQIAGLSGMFIGLVAGGILSTVDWRLVFWVNVPVGIYGTLWAYWKLRETGTRSARAHIDWWGNLTFAVGLSGILIASTYGIQPYGGHTMGWTDPWVLAGLIGGALMLVGFVAIEARVAAPMVNLALFRIRPFWAGNLAGFAISLSRGGFQFMIVIWLQGIWLPLHGYSFAKTPLWAGIYMLPLTVGFMVSGPISGTLSDRLGSRGLATGGAALTGLCFIGLMLLGVDFSYWIFALLLALLGAATGMFASPNSSSIMGSVPAPTRTRRGVGDALDLPELGHRDQRRRVLHPGHHRRGRHAALDPLHGAALSRAPGGRGPPAGRAAAGVEPVRGAARHQPDPAPARRVSRSPLSVPLQPGRPDRPRLLPPPAVGPVPQRPDRRVRDRRRTLGAGRARLARPRQHPSERTPDMTDLDPTRTALLSMDFQNAIVSQVPDAAALVARQAAAIAAARGAGLTVAHVRVGFADGEAPAGQMAKRIPREMLEHFHADAPGTQIHDDLAPAAGEIVVRKVRVGPFSTTDLHEQLRRARDRHADPHRDLHQRRRAVGRPRRPR